MAGYKPVTAQGVHQRTPRTQRRARNLKADLRRGHPQPHIDHLRAGFTRDIICLPDRRVYPLPGESQREIGNREKAKPIFPERKSVLEIFLYSWVRMKKEECEHE